MSFLPAKWIAGSGCSFFRDLLEPAEEDGRDGRECVAPLGPQQIGETSAVGLARCIDLLVVDLLCSFCTRESTASKT